ncbi:ligase-associated DNA damage response endonuclease PdeM [Pedobacter sp. SYP-B3415]|uniref:ligase-associated DNA damage response endonuclease PdeM n=1 Tax=Pedobacter sp. SYP-B3415 TaxID=2496641 RepID=UPI00101D713E|nr:ligase-associated DNA damage response endonuclease PdeM [Pedobacter sp. SYP-B3415]
MEINCKGERIILDEERAIFLPEHDLLVLSDLHLGKSAHFRRAGVPVPATVGLNDLARLSGLLARHKPEALLITGDMFHHSLNSDIDHFSSWRRTYNELRLILVKGNHDLLTEADYEAMNIEVHSPSFCLGPFCFIHDAPKCTEEELYPISGHIHPGITLQGRAKQKLRFPCYYFGTDFAVLPAFSLFTGLSSIRQHTGDRAYAITPGKVVAV